MNFHIEKAVASGGRIGQITQFAHGRTLSLATPMCTLFTKGGSVPFLSLSMVEKIKHAPQIVTMSINSFVEHYDSIHEYGKGLSGFTSMKDKLIFSTLHDASLPVPSGKNDKSGVAVWGKGGKTKLDPGQYMKIQESLKPDWLLAINDGDTDQDSGEKRAGKAVDRTLDFLDDMVTEREKREDLKTSSLIGVVVGGYSERQRVRSAKETATRPVHGFLLGGFQKGHTEENILEIDLFRQILLKTLKHLPENKPRIMENPWSPLQVIKAFKLGVDVFSSAYPHILAEKGMVMIEDFSLPALSQTAQLEKQQSGTSSAGSIIDVKDKKYFDDFGPLLDGCSCYTCATFTRSYIHHLLNTSELLANVLLTIHNFEMYFEFFHSLRNALQSERLDELEKKLSQQEKQESRH